VTGAEGYPKRRSLTTFVVILWSRLSTQGMGPERTLEPHRLLGAHEQEWGLYHVRPSRAMHVDASVVDRCMSIYTMYPFSTAISAFIIELVAAPNRTLSTRQMNFTSSTLHFLTRPTETAAPFSRSRSNRG